MNNFLSFSAGGSGAIEAENPVYDLLLKDEELEAAAGKAHADMRHMYRRLALLDEQHSAYEPLLETLGSSVEEMRTTSNLTYGRTMQAIDQLNNREFLNSTQWLIALSLLAGGIALRPYPARFCRGWRSRSYRGRRCLGWGRRRPASKATGREKP